MKLSDRLHMLLKATMDDLFAEEDPDGGESGSLPQGQSALETFLAEAQHSLDALRLRRVEAEQRERRAGVEVHQAKAGVDAGEKIIEELLKAGQEDEARRKLHEQTLRQERFHSLEDHYRACHDVTKQLEEAISSQQARLDEVNRRYAELRERERSAILLEELQSRRKELRQQAEALAASLDQRTEQVARREDKLAARKQWNKPSGN